MSNKLFLDSPMRQVKYPSVSWPFMVREGLQETNKVKVGWGQVRYQSI